MQIKQGRTTPHCPTGNGKERRRRRRPVVAAVALVSAAASSSRLASRGGKHGNGDGRRLSGSCPCRGQASRRRRGAGKSVRADRSLAGWLLLLLHLPKFSCNNYSARRVESIWPCVRRSIDIDQSQEGIRGHRSGHVWVRDDLRRHYCACWLAHLGYLATNGSAAATLGSGCPCIHVGVPCDF